MDTTKEKKNQRDTTFSVRISKAENQMICQKAKLCGLNKSKYARKVLTGHQPKARMTDAEREAYLSLSTVRGDLMKIANVLKGKSQEERKAYFADVNFMRYWIKAVDQLIQQWRTILERLK